MSDHMAFRASDEVQEAVEDYRDEIEEEVGHRPDKSDVLRVAVREYLDVEPKHDAPQERGAA